jgi:branched-chain amino acid transport system ATP-binding protein
MKMMRRPLNRGPFDRRRRQPGTRRRKFGEVILDVKNISLAFGGVKALTDISFDVREHECAPSSAPTAPARARC